MTRGLWLCGLILAGSFAACVTNHDELAKKPSPSAGGTLAGGSFGAAGSRPQLGGSGGTASGGRVDDEPPGKSVLTIVNGIVDAPRLTLCLAKLDEQSNAIPFGDPLSNDALEYAHSLVFGELSLAGLADLAEDTLQTFVIAGELDLIAGLDCEAAIARARAEEALSVSEPAANADGGAAGVGSLPSVAAGNGSADAGNSGAAGSAGAPETPAVRSRLRVRALPAISAGTLNAGRSLLLVANGCLGGATFGHAQGEAYCGAGYSEREPTVSAILVSLSRRVAFDRTGMQVVNASPANPEIFVRSSAPLPSQDFAITIASNVVPGQVAPRPATTTYSALDLGSSRLHRIDVATRNGPLFGESWGSALERGGLDELLDTHTYALVLSGPEAKLEALPDLFNGPALTVVSADPE